MPEMLSRVASASGRWGFIWHRARPHLATLLKEESPIALKWAIFLAFPHMPWDRFANGRHLIQLWAAAVSTAPYTDEIGQSVMDALLHIAPQDPLRPHIPVSMWLWLNKQLPFPLVCRECFRGTQ